MQRKKYNIENLEWDTNFFGIKSARICLNEKVEENDIQDMINELKKENYQFVTIRNIENQNKNNYALKNVDNIFLADVNIEFKKELEGVIKLREKLDINNNLEYNQEIINISKDSFKYSRFINDINLKKSSEVYVQWAKNAFNREDKYFCTYKENHKVVGYLLFSISNKKLVIELIAVSRKSQGKGIGKKLIENIEEFALKNKITTIQVGTQLNNISAQNFYIKCGFKHVANHSIYHLWL